MKKIQMVLFAMLAVFAFGAVTAVTASAEETLLAEWLVEGSPITALLSTETLGAILLEDANAPVVRKASVLCNGILDGSIGPNGEDEVTSVLNLAGEEVGELGGLALLGTSSTGPDCVTEESCAVGSEGSPIEVFPLGLPWLSELFLMANGEILNLITSMNAADGNLVGYELLCLVLGINSEDTCTAEKLEFKVENDPEGGDAAVPAATRSEPNANCSLGGVESGVNETDELAEIKLLEVGLLTVSSV